MKTLTKEEFKKKYGEEGLNQLNSIGNTQTDSTKPNSFGEFATGFTKGLLESSIGTARMLQSGGQRVLAAIDPTRNLEQIQNTTGIQSLQGKQAEEIDKLLKSENTAQKAGKLTAFLSGLFTPSGSRKAVISGAEKISSTLDNAINTTEKATNKLKTIVQEGIKPTPSLIESTGQILQGKQKDLKAGIESIQSIKTKGIKTFSDLNKVFDEKIKTLAQKVDADLAQDKTTRTLDLLNTVKKTKTGGEVTVNYVDNALNQLDELYTKTGDVVAKADIQDLINVAKSRGLTNQEINDIARTYGAEFGSKAFNKIGEPLTSVNSQMYENTRKGIKELARQGLKGAEAKKADELMSKIYNTQNLIKKNVDAVTKLKQRIQERGLLEKIGNNVSKYADLLTGGSLRGLVGGLLPRGAGYKVMNALDLEELLQNNLNIINKASKAKTAKAFKELTGKLIKK